MGLDMYLIGTKRNYEYPIKTMDEGRKVIATEVELGYWRKHPNLHGYIVQTFAGGVDNCERIHLTIPKIEEIIQAIKDKELPHTTGFFFGESDGSEDEESIKIFEEAIEWIKREKEDEGRYVYYEASW